MKLVIVFFIAYLSNSDALSFRDQYAKSIATPELVDYLKAPLQPNPAFKASVNASNLKVGIIGAGISGLYAGLILDSLGINFEILEANDEHLGGRAYSYYFNKNHQDSKICQSFYDYVEIGAMRIPKSVKRVVGDEQWSLVNYLKNNKNVKLYKPNLIKFYYSNDNSLYFYNNQTIYYDDPQLNDSLRFGDSNNGGLGNGVPDSYAAKAYWTWLDLAVKPFTDLMKIDLSKSYQFIKEYDNHSVKSFLATFDAKDLLNKMGFSTANYVSYLDSKTSQRLDRQYPPLVINWIESLDSGTGFYDRSLAETVIDAFEFGSADWVTIDGGISRLVDGMVEAIGLNRIRMNSKVVRIAKSAQQLQVTTSKNLNFKYDHVISTVPLGLLQSIDTRTLNFDLKKRMSIRMLTYEASVKVGLKFRTRWWEDPIKMKGKPIVGGQTFTDLPIRKIVYPSHGVGCKNMTGNLLIYLWGQDATRFGGRIKGKIPTQNVLKQEDDLIQEILDQMTLIHGPIVRREYMNTYFAFNWNDNPLSLGAFALYGPSQYNTLYRSMIKAEADGKLHFGGEATSVHHGWIQGAVNAGYRTVMEILMKENLQTKLSELKAKWSEVEELSFFS